jgi:hypothetical protein
MREWENLNRRSEGIITVASRVGQAPGARPAGARTSLPGTYAASGIRPMSAAHRLFTPGRLVRACTFLAGAVAASWGLYRVAVTVLERGGSDELVSGLIWVFLGAFLVFLAGHEKAVAKSL